MNSVPDQNENFIVAYTPEKGWMFKNIVSGELLTAAEYKEKYGFLPELPIASNKGRTVTIKSTSLYPNRATRRSRN